jgi:CheY-like chemotaxis protein
MNAPNLRVLVVEDDADCAESVALLLNLFGLVAEVVRSGPGALEAARVRPPDVVLLDLALPGMNGYDVARALGDEGRLREGVAGRLRRSGLRPPPDPGRCPARRRLRRRGTAFTPALRRAARPGLLGGRVLWPKETSRTPKHTLLVLL